MGLEIIEKFILSPSGSLPLRLNERCWSSFTFTAKSFATGGLFGIGATTTLIKWRTKIPWLSAHMNSIAAVCSDVGVQLNVPKAGFPAGIGGVIVAPVGSVRPSKRTVSAVSGSKHWIGKLSVPDGLILRIVALAGVGGTSNLGA